MLSSPLGRMTALAGIAAFGLLTALAQDVKTAEFAEQVAENWHQWRGPDANGVSETARPVLHWSENRNVQWKKAIDGKGSSTPIVWGDKIFLLTAVDTGVVDPSLPRPEDQPRRIFGITHPNTQYEFVVLCLDRNDGRELWRRIANRKIPHEGHHGDNNFASASPVTDGSRLYCWFGSAGLYCYDLAGNKHWDLDLGPAVMGASLGEGSSPVWHDGRLVIVRDHQGQSFIYALDASTGEILWKRARDEDNSWATPRVVAKDGLVQVIASGSKAIVSYNLANGDTIWHCRGLTDNPIPSPVGDSNSIYFMTGYRGYALLALPLGRTGDLADTGAVLWRKNRGTPYTPSPVLAQDLLFFNQSNQALWSCLDARTGEVYVDRERLPGLATVYASPVASKRHLFVTGRNGKTVVLDRAKRLQVVATNQLDDVFDASPALAGDQILLRGNRYLYAIAESGGERSESTGLSRSEASAALARVWAESHQKLREERRDEMTAKILREDELTMRFQERVFGSEPEDGHSLWISMHGGGGTASVVNDRQWQNQIGLYQPAEGIYVAPRAPTDTWNLWHRSHIDEFFDRLIENYVALRGVNPNRVYLMGYSAGGDGVYQLGPRMADRWAAVAMMAGHPNDARPDNLRNLGFGLFMGANDNGYGRNKVAEQWRVKLAQLSRDHPGGYRHLVRIYPDTGHWMNRKDAEALPWMAKFTRNPWPETVVWNQAKGINSRLYWLAIPRDALVKGQRIRAEVEDQTIRITAEKITKLTVRLSDRLLDLDRPVTVIVNGQEKFSGIVPRTEQAIRDSLSQRADPASAATATISFEDLSD